MSLAAVFSLMIPPPPPPPVWRPALYPEYRAACRVVDVTGSAYPAELAVKGQEGKRELALVLHAGKRWPARFSGTAAPLVQRTVGENAYALEDYLQADSNLARRSTVPATGRALSVLARSLHPDPASILVRVVDSASPPGVGHDVIVGLCRIKQSNWGRPS